MFGRKKPRDPAMPPVGAPVQPDPHAPMPPDPHAPQEPPVPRRHRRRWKFRPVQTVLMLIGLVTVAVLLMIYVIVPILVQLNVLFGGAA